jgi:hypothetical protein
VRLDDREVRTVYDSWPADADAYDEAAAFAQFWTELDEYRRSASAAG